ncbi:hypothetical protein SXCC_01849 [Gluconacetobacter sp. SXCC-1]|nr:hypothetical protein SXCC_01849 [Gluconacetobacter sp. SXCC-1]
MPLAAGDTACHAQYDRRLSVLPGQCGAREGQQVSGHGMNPFIWSPDGGCLKGAPFW